MPCNLSLGTKSPQVYMLQEVMQKRGYYVGYRLDSYFGPVLQKEVSRWQRNHGLTVDGCVGCETWNSAVYPPCPWSATPTPIIPPVGKITTINDCLGTYLRVGSSGDCVRILQQKLQDFGFYKAQVDGSYGQLTKQAVMDFQRVTNHTPDGECGPKTWGSVPGYVAPKQGVVQGDAWVFQELSTRGDVSTDQNLCYLLNNKGTYLYYYDQGQSQFTTVKNLSGNCADLVNDLGLPYYRARNIPCRGVHCQVKCSDGNWYGHYVIEIGAPGSGILRDPAAWCKGKGLNQLICSGGYKFLHYEGNSIP